MLTFLGVFFSKEAVPLPGPPDPLLIPYDVQYAIIEFLDFESLKIASLLNQDHHHQAEKYLWKSFTLLADHSSTAEARKMLQDRCEAVLTHATYLRHLRLFIKSPLGIEGEDEEVERILQQGLRAMQSAVNIVSLDVRSFYHNAAIAQGISGMPFAPCLTSFTTDLVCGDELSGFWASHPLLGSLDLLSREASTTPLNFQTLPSLTTLRVASAHQAHVALASNLTSFTIRKIKDEDCPILLRYLASSIASLTHLDITVKPQSLPTPVIYTEIIAHFQRLRKLRISHACIPDTAGQITASNVIVSLGELEDYEWCGLAINIVEEKFDLWLAGCRSLRKATFHWHVAVLNRRQKCVLERATPESKWVVVDRA